MMTHLARLLALGACLALGVVGGCGPCSPGPPSGGSPGGDVAAEDPVLPADPEEPAVRAFVEQAVQARIRGDAAALKALCQPALAGKIAELAPRPLDFEIRAVEVLSRTARVEVWTRDPAFDPRDNQALVTYDLVRDGDGWKIADARAATYFDALTSQSLETTP